MPHMVKSKSNQSQVKVKLVMSGKIFVLLWAGWSTLRTALSLSGRDGNDTERVKMNEVQFVCGEADLLVKDLDTGELVTLEVNRCSRHRPVHKVQLYTPQP